jgi:tetratricopeptide (TPR) repeat protein
MQKFLLTAAAALCALALCAGNRGDAAENELLEAYSSMQFSKAKKLAAGSKRPEFQLIGALCEVFDRRSQNLKHGMPELQRLSRSPELPEKYRPTALLAYARAIHTLGFRKNVYPQAEGVDPTPLYDEVLAKYPTSTEAVFAAIYRTTLMFDTQKNREGISFLENFIRNFKGNPKLLGAAHSLLAQEYILSFEDYKSAVKHYIAFRDLGVANPKHQAPVQFKIARIYDFRLNDYAAAEKEYIRFLKEHPDSGEAVIVKRYLKELKARRESK